MVKLDLSFDIDHNLGISSDKDLMKHLVRGMIVKVSRMICVGEWNVDNLQ